MKKLLALLLAASLTIGAAVLPLTGTTLIINSFRFAPGIPHVADSNARLSLTAEGVVVSGAGSTDANGFFSQRGISNDEPLYYRSDQPTGSHYRCQWGSDRDGATGQEWEIIGASKVVYFSTEDVARPDLVTLWETTSEGSDPPPTVTHSPGQVTGAGYQVIQDSDGLTYTFNGDGADADAGLWVTGAGDVTWNFPFQFDISGNYRLIPDTGSAVNDAGGGAWTTNDNQYFITTPSTYPWQQPWDVTPFTGTPPAPTVLRNPICAEANWSHP